MRQGLAIACAGLACGVVSALVLTRYLTTMRFGVEPTDPITFGVLSVAAVPVSALACYAPARRSARGAPVSAISAGEWSPWASYVAHPVCLRFTHALGPA